MRTHLSPEAQVMLRPFRSYPALAAASSSATNGWLWMRRPLLMVGTLGAFVALSSAGRLVLWHVLFAAAFWAWAPLYQALAVALTVKTLDPGRRGNPDAMTLGRAVDLYFMGHGTWYLFLLSLVAVAFAAPDVYAVFTTLILHTFILPAALLGTIAWSLVISYAYFRRALGWSKGRSWAGLGMFYGLVILALLSWYIPTGQLLPALRGL